MTLTHFALIYFPIKHKKLVIYIQQINAEFTQHDNVCVSSLSLGGMKLVMMLRNSMYVHIRMPIYTYIRTYNTHTYVCMYARTHMYIYSHAHVKSNTYRGVMSECWYHVYNIMS